MTAQRVNHSLRRPSGQPGTKSAQTKPRHLAGVCAGIVARLARQLFGRPQLRALPNAPDQADRELLFSLAEDLTPAAAKMVIVRLAAHGKVDGATAIDCLNALGLRSA